MEIITVFFLNKFLMASLFGGPGPNTFRYCSSSENLEEHLFVACAFQTFLNLPTSRRIGSSYLSMEPLGLCIASTYYTKS